MKRFVTMFFFFGALCSTSHAHRIFGELRLDVCHVMLQLWSQGNSITQVESLRQASLNEAIQSFRDFRQHLLPHAEELPEAHARRIRAARNSNQRNIEASLGRVLGIEFDARSAGQTNENGQTRQMVGYTVIGRENIERFLSQFQEGNPFAIFMVANVGGATLGVWGLDHFTHHPSAGAFTLGTFWFVNSLRGIEQYVRSTDFGIHRFNDRIQEFLENPHAGEWYLDGDTLSINRELVERLHSTLSMGQDSTSYDLERGRLNVGVQHNYAQERNNELNRQLGFIDDLTTRLLPYLITPSERTYVSWDRLVRLNPSTGQLEMTITLRFSTTAPHYPERSSEPVILPNLQPTGLR